MLTVNYERLGLRPGDRLLDLGCGAGRHAFEALRRGARVVALDRDEGELGEVTGMFSAMTRDGQIPDGARSGTVRSDATRLPYPDGAFDRIIASEVLEHIPADTTALGELARVLRPGGTMAVTVPAWLAERLCWALSDQYHAPAAEGGHVRIYRRSELRGKLADAGLVPGGHQHAHGLHSPYWWLRCAVGPDHDQHPLVRRYHQVLVWDIADTRPWSHLTRLADRLLSPVVGKSVVVYARKPAVPAATGPGRASRPVTATPAVPGPAGQAGQARWMAGAPEGQEMAGKVG